MFHFHSFLPFLTCRWIYLLLHFCCDIWSSGLGTAGIWNFTILVITFVHSVTVSTLSLRLPALFIPLLFCYSVSGTLLYCYELFDLVSDGTVMVRYCIWLLHYALTLFCSRADDDGDTYLHCRYDVWHSGRRSLQFSSAVGTDAIPVVYRYCHFNYRPMNILLPPFSTLQAVTDTVRYGTILVRYAFCSLLFSIVCDDCCRCGTLRCCLLRCAVETVLGLVGGILNRWWNSVDDSGDLLVHMGYLPTLRYWWLLMLGTFIRYCWYCCWLFILCDDATLLFYTFSALMEVLPSVVTFVLMLFWCLGDVYSWAQTWRRYVPVRTTVVVDDDTCCSAHSILFPLIPSFHYRCAIPMPVTLPEWFSGSAILVVWLSSALLFSSFYGTPFRPFCDGRYCIHLCATMLLFLLLLWCPHCGIACWKSVLRSHWLICSSGNRGDDAGTLCCGNLRRPLHLRYAVFTVVVTGITVHLFWWEFPFVLLIRCIVWVFIVGSLSWCYGDADDRWFPIGAFVTDSTCYYSGMCVLLHYVSHSVMPFCSTFVLLRWCDALMMEVFWYLLEWRWWCSWYLKMHSSTCWHFVFILFIVSRWLYDILLMRWLLLHTLPSTLH